MLFSSVIPLDAMPEATEIWKTATAFGATCHVELSNRVTHVVAAKVRNLISIISVIQTSCSVEQQRWMQLAG